VTPSDEVKAVDRLVGQMADLSVVGGEAGGPVNTLPISALKRDGGLR